VPAVLPPLDEVRRAVDHVLPTAQFTRRRSPLEPIQPYSVVAGDLV